MITDNEIYKDLINLKTKLEFIVNPKNSNETKSNFWSPIFKEINTIINHIKKDKRIYSW